jgi:hypothetical protein
MPEYHVTWEIELIADAPREAAVKALAIQRDPDSIATVFDVKDEAGTTERIDLEDAGDETCAACGRAFEEDESIIQAPPGRNYCRECFNQGQG